MGKEINAIELSLLQIEDCKRKIKMLKVTIKNRKKIIRQHLDLVRSNYLQPE